MPYVWIVSYRRRETERDKEREAERETDRERQGESNLVKIVLGFPNKNGRGPHASNGMTRRQTAEKVQLQFERKHCTMNEGPLLGIFATHTIFFACIPTQCRH